MDNIYWELIAKNLSGNASPGEVTKLQDWLNEHPENLQRFNHAKEIWDSIQKKEDRDVDLEKGWEIMKAKLMESNEEAKVISIQRYKFNWLYVAASVIIILLGALFLLLNPNSGSEPRFDHEISSVSAEVFILPDSSIIWLNKNSSIKFNNNFKEERTIYLDGEAYFEVKRDESKPFVIHTPSSYTRVLGTSFNLKAYKDQSTTELIVNSGKVSFASGKEGKMVLLEKGEKGLVKNGTNLVEEEINDDPNYLSWKSNKQDFLKSKRYLEERSKSAVTYLYAKYHWKENIIKQTVIEGKVSNAAIFTSYDHITLKATYLGPNEKLVGEEQFMINKKINPGDELIFKHKLKNWLKTTKEVNVEVVGAKIIEE